MNIFLSILAGLLLVLSFPPFSIDLLIWIALLPLFFAIQATSIRESLNLGAITGLVFFGGTLYWFHRIFLFGLTSLGFIGLLSLSFAIFCALLKFFQRRARSLSLMVIAPILWVAVESLRSDHWPLGFPWMQLGYSQFQRIPLIQIASLVGVSGLSYLIVLVNSSLYNLIRMWRFSPRRASLPLLFVALLLTTGLVWGNKVSSIEESTNIKVAAVQDESFDLERLEKLTQEAALVQPDIIVWPELSCYPHFVLDEPGLYNRLSSLAKRSKAYLIIGSLDKVKGAKSGSYYNTALLLSPKGTLVGKYHKVHPVQFTKGVVPGKAISCHDTRLGKIGIQICYDSDYNDVSRKLIREGAEMLFVPNLDPIRWGRVQHLQHSAMTLFRAVENRRWVLRAASSGASQIIDPYGRVLHSLGIGDVGVLVGSIARRRDLSIFTRFGFAFPYLCQATVVVLFAIIGVKGKE